jgi:SM-20-related protein
VVRDAFLCAARIRGLIECAEARRERGDFKAAGVGTARRHRQDIRGDSTCWLAEPLFEPERALLQDFEELRLELNREGFLGLFDLELHYAWYPPGAGYARHLDQLQERSQRQVSLILYLNERWEPGAGGELRLFGAAEGHRDVAPLAGRLTYFLTAGREHAVLPTRDGRLSISGWFRRRS